MVTEMSFLTTHSISVEILSVCWVNCFQRERQMRFSNNMEELLLLYLWNMFRLLPLGLPFSGNEKRIPSLRPQESQGVHRVQMHCENPEDLQSLRASSSRDIMLITSTLSVFPSLTLPPSACEGVLSSRDPGCSDGLLSLWQAWSPGRRLSFSERLVFTLNRELESNA